MPSPDELVAALPKLECFQMTSAGYNALDVPCLAAKGIAVANNGGANAVSVAEHTLTLLLALQHRLVEMHSHVQAGDWSGYAAPPHRELAGSTVGIVGFGNIGRLVARKLAGFEVELLYSDTGMLPPGRDGELGVTQVQLEELLARSDVVTLHVPLLPSTVGLIGVAELALMKPSAILLNTCRGAVVDECAVAAALDTGKLGGFGADVLVEEPPSADHPLLARPNVLITPHMAGTAAPASARSFAFAIENVARLARGEKMLCVVDPADFAVVPTSQTAHAAPVVRAEPAGLIAGSARSRLRCITRALGSHSGARVNASAASCGAISSACARQQRSGATGFTECRRLTRERLRCGRIVAETKPANTTMCGHESCDRAPTSCGRLEDSGLSCGWRSPAERGAAVHEGSAGAAARDVRAAPARPRQAAVPAAGAMAAMPAVSAAEAEELDVTGAVVVPDLLSPERTAALRGDVLRLLEAEGTAAGIEFRQEDGVGRLANLARPTTSAVLRFLPTASFWWHAGGKGRLGCLADHRARGAEIPLPPDRPEPQAILLQRTCCSSAPRPGRRPPATPR
eukprot:SAG11_NODE_348_length_10402_cov_8.763467_8_plen_571_part_00